MALPPNFSEVREALPAFVTPTTAKASCVPGVTEKWVTSYILRVRSMGTASYIRIGNVDAQEYSLTVVGQVKGWSANPGELLNLAKVFHISDTADAVIEIIATYYEAL